MRIGTVEINSQLALAPMAGVTDAAFRELCASLGAGLTCTELVSSKALCYQDKKSRTLLAPFPGEHPMQAQIFGSDPVCMAEAAQIAIETSGADINPWDFFNSFFGNGYYGSSYSGESRDAA